MYAIGKIFLSNYGVDQSWYDGVMLDFMDTESKCPTDAILNLENGGGKTTLLSFIFSLFETRSSHFLKSLQNNVHRLAHYFSEDGCPGIIAMQWQSPNSPNQKPFVIGQAISRKRTLDDEEIERVFFSFVECDGLSLKSLPAPKLCERPARSLTDFKKWITDVQKTPGAAFFQTSQPTKWQAHLQAERGIDVELLKQQLVFSKQEGSIDTGFLNFKNELEFLRRFFYLTIDQERANSVRTNVTDACDKLQRKPFFTKKLVALQSVASALQLFAIACHAFAQERATFEQCSGKLAVVLATLNMLSTRYLRHCEEFKSARRNLEDERAELRATAEHLRHRIDLAEFAKLKLELQNAENAYALHQDRLLRCKKEHRLAEAAQMAQEVQKQKRKHDVLNADKLAAESGLLPFEQNARYAGTLLKCSLLRDKEANERKIQELKQRETEAKALVKAIEKEVAAIGRKISEVLAELRTIQRDLEKFAARKKTLLAEGYLLHVEEQLADAYARWITERQQLETGVATVTQDLGECRRYLERLSVKEQELSHAITLKKAEKTRLQEIVLKAQQEREALQFDPSLCLALESDKVDPDSEQLALNAETYRRQIGRNLNELAVRLHELHNDRSSIDETRLAKRNTDVEQVLRRLRELRVRNCHAFASYIAEMEKDANKARLLVNSNPSKFLGIAVSNKQDFARAKQLLENPPALLRPVVISIATDVPDESDMHFTVPSESDAAFNLVAAQEFAKQLESKIQVERLTEQRLVETSEALSIAIQKVKTYFREWGQGRLIDTINRLRHLEDELVDMEAVRVSFLKDKADRKAQEDELLLQIGELNTVVKKAEGAIHSLKILIPEEELISDSVTRQYHLAQDLVDNEQKEKESRSALDRARADEQEHFRVSVNLDSEAKFLAKELLSVKHMDDALNAEEIGASIERRATDEFRENYRLAIELLEREERQRIGDLLIHLKQAREVLTRLQQDYEGKFYGIPFVTAVAFLDEGKSPREELDRLVSLEIEITSAKEIAVATKAIARQAFEEFSRLHRDVKEDLSFLAMRIDELARIIADEKLHLSVAESRSNEVEAELIRNDDSLKEAELQAMMLNREIANVRLQGTELPPAQPDDELFPETKSIPDRVNITIKDYKQGENNVRLTLERVKKTHNDLRQSIFESNLAEFDAEIAQKLNTNELEDTITNCDLLSESIADRVETVRHLLDGMRKEFDTAVGEVSILLNQGMSIFGSALQKRVPADAPFVGGKPILKTNGTLASITSERKRQVIVDYLDNVIESGTPPQSGSDLVADVLIKSFEKAIKIDILKMSPEEDFQYVQVGRLATSGGEAATMAMFLYLLIAQLRADLLADAKRQFSGPLILDNPFAKVTHPKMWEAQRMLAKVMGVQLIFTTAILDFNALGEFERIVRLRRNKKNSVTGRLHIEVAGMQLLTS